MSCLAVNISLAQASAIINVSQIGDAFSVNASLADEPAVVHVLDAADHLSISVGMVCAADSVVEIRWDEETLTFTNEDIGKAKIGHLTSSDSWVIHEIDGYDVYPQGGNAGDKIPIDISASAVNEGIDKTTQLHAVCRDKQSTLTLLHQGARQRFITSDGMVFCVSDGSRFLVLKQ